MQFFILGFPQIIGPLFSRFEIDYPQCWIGINLLTKSLIGSYGNGIPGDIDFVIGRLTEDRSIDLTYFVAFQVKVCRVDPNDEPKIDSYGTTQTKGTALLGFDRTVLFHIMAQEEKTLPNEYAASWSGLENIPHPRVFERLLGKIKAQMKADSRQWPFGYGILGCGQIERSNPRLRGAFSPMIFIDAPMRPLGSNDSVRQCRRKMEKGLRALWGERYVASSEPAFLYSETQGLRPTPHTHLPKTL